MDKSDYRLMVRASFPDALVLGALSGLLRDVFPDSYFLPECCGYIPGRGAKTAVRQVMSALSQGYGTVLRLDILSFNDTVPQEKLLGLISRRLNDAGWDLEDLRFFHGLMRLFFSKVDAVLGTPGVGIGMGTSLTPLFTNIYLSPLDHFIKGKNIPFSRFGDDLALFFTDRSCAKAPRATWRPSCRRISAQRINDSKAAITELGTATGDGADGGREAASTSARTTSTWAQTEGRLKDQSGHHRQDTTEDQAADALSGGGTEPVRRPKERPAWPYCP